MNKRATGTEYEQRAGVFLQEQGYEILQYNFRCKKGEIDIIAREGKYLVFVEVKYRKSKGSGDPLEAVHLKKQQIISNVAHYYCLTHGCAEGTPCRFDVVAVLGEDITLVQNAFDYCGYF